MKTRDTNGRWKQGVSGNPKGRPPKNLCISDILTDIGQELEDGISNLENVLRTVYKKAIRGDMKAIEFIADRTEGKPILMEKKTYTRPFDAVVFIEDGKEIHRYDGI